MFTRVLTTSMLVFVVSALPALAGNEKNYTYLALGDSIPFGLDIRLLPPIAPTSPLPTADQFSGYPEVIADVLRLDRSKKAVNASCPGETSGSFLQAGTLDYGCMSPGPQNQPGFKTSIGLHTNYSVTQGQFAMSQLAANKHIDLVTLSIGGNDLLLLQQACAMQGPQFPACVSVGLGPVLNRYAENLTAILGGLRSTYSGKLILVKYYSPSLDPLSTGAIAALNDVMEQVGSHFDATIADSFAAFQFASALAGGDPCAAGLLIRLSPTVCDIHPSPAGTKVIAASVLLAIVKKSR